jgi:hypothetical protein
MYREFLELLSSDSEIGFECLYFECRDQIFPRLFLIEGFAGVNVSGDEISFFIGMNADVRFHNEHKTRKTFDPWLVDLDYVGEPNPVHSNQCWEIHKKVIVMGNVTAQFLIGSIAVKCQL